VLGVWVIVLIVGLTLLVLLWGGGGFLQGYIYTEPSSGLFWQAPAAAVVLTLFYALWCLLDYGASRTPPGYLPYDTIFNFKAEETRGTEPVKRLWAIREIGKGASKRTEKIRYARFKEILFSGLSSYRYYQERADGAKGTEAWNGNGVVALVVVEDGQEVRYDRVPSEEGQYAHYVSPDGWTIKTYESGPTEPPSMFRTGLWLLNLLLNLVHLGLWFVCLWLLMRFQWRDALWLGFVLWLAMTLTALPMMLASAGAA
jgi:hypothetical protein